MGSSKTRDSVGDFVRDLSRGLEEQPWYFFEDPEGLTLSARAEKILGAGHVSLDSMRARMAERERLLDAFAKVVGRLQNITVLPPMDILNFRFAASCKHNAFQATKIAMAARHPNSEIAPPSPRLNPEDIKDVPEGTPLIPAIIKQEFYPREVELPSGVNVALEACSEYKKAFERAAGKGDEGFEKATIAFCNHEQTLSFLDAAVAALKLDT